MFDKSEGYGLFLKLLNKILFVLIVLGLPSTILLSCVSIITFDLNHYIKQYEKYDIPDETGISKNELIIATENLLDYMQDKRNDLNFKSIINDSEEEFFSERDKLHMIDVKNIFKLIKLIRNILVLTLASLIIFNRLSKNMKINKSKCLMLSSFFGALPFIILIVLINLDFSKYFTVFHEIFFNNDLWLLDPDIDRLVNIFPEEFFAYTAIKILSYYFILLGIIFIIGAFIRLKESKGSIASK